MDDDQVYVCDFEWNPETKQLLWCGFFDGTTYAGFPDLESFLGHVLTPEMSGKTIFAHGGAYGEFPFLLAWSMVAITYRVRGGADRVYVSELELERGEHRWQFVDSYVRLLRKPVISLAREMAADFPQARLSFVPTVTEDGASLAPYNEADCRIVHEALSRLEKKDRLNARYGAVGG